MIKVEQKTDKYIKSTCDNIDISARLELNKDFLIITVY